MTQSENSHGNAPQLIGKVYEILSSLAPPPKSMKNISGKILANHNGKAH